MQILTTRRLKFVVGDLSFTTKGGGNIESAPDWIARDDYFRGAISIGVLRVFGEEKKSKPKQTPVEPSEPTNESVPPSTETEETTETEPTRTRRRRNSGASEGSQG